MTRAVPSCNPAASSSGAPSSLNPCDQVFQVPLDTTALTRATLPQLGGSLAPVVSGAIGSGQIGCVHLADGAVCSRAIASGAVTQDKIGSGVTVPAALTSGIVRSGHIGDNAITSGNIAAGQVGAVHLAAGAVRPLNIFAGAVQSGHLVATPGLEPVQPGTISSGAVVSGNIASGQIGEFHLASGLIQLIQSGVGGSSTVNSGAIVSGAVGTSEIRSGTIVSDATRLVNMSGGPLLTSPAKDAFFSGCAPVTIDASGRIVLAMCDVAGRMPAIGLASGSPVSGTNIELVRAGVIETGLSTSGQVQKLVYPGQSGSLVFAPPATGVQQVIGLVLNNAGRILLGDFKSGGPVTSGGIASGTITQFDFASGLGVSLPTLFSGQPLFAGATRIDGYPGLIVGTQFPAVRVYDASRGLALQATNNGVYGGVKGGLNLAGSHIVTWANNEDPVGVNGQDVAIARIASGRLQVNNTASGSIGYMEAIPGSGCVVSGSIASGQIGINHLASGVRGGGGGVASGVTLNLYAEELISGLKPVSMSLSGGIRVTPMLVTSGWMVMGVANNIASGTFGDVVTHGIISYTSGMIDTPNIGKRLWYCSGGFIATMSGSWASGGVGGIALSLGVALYSGTMHVNIGTPIAVAQSFPGI